MALILIVEDDAVIRLLIATVLRKEGHKVLTAEDGRAGLELVRQSRPDLVISDVRMPSMDGFAMLEALRADPSLTTTPVVFLTSLQQRSHLRIGMTSGADDYITKPFQPWELRDAVAAQLRRRNTLEEAQKQSVEAEMERALAEQKQHLASLYEERLVFELSGQWPSADPASQDEQYSSATVLFANVLNYAGLAEKLSCAELRDVVRKFYQNASDTVHLFGAQHIQFVGEGLMVVFVDSADGIPLSHGFRAARAALGLIDAAKRVQQFLTSRFPHRDLPDFEVNVALNSGPVELAKLEDPIFNEKQILPLGDTVNVALLLQAQMYKWGWKIAASVSTLGHLEGAVTTRGRKLISLPRRDAPVDAAELVDLAVNSRVRALA